MTGFVTAIAGWPSCCLGLLLFAALGCVMAASAGRLQNFLDKSDTYRALPVRDHVPTFRVVAFPPPGDHARGSEWYWLYDGKQKIGLVQTWTREVEMFRFTPPDDGKIVHYRIPEIHHWPTLVGARIQMSGYQTLPPVEALDFTWARKQGEALEFTTVQRHKGGVEGAATLRLAWDERLGYIWRGTVHYKMAEPHEIEFTNLLAGGVSDSRNNRKRWQKTVRGSVDGEIRYVCHNPLNVPAEDIDPRGFVGFVTEPEMNPFVEVERLSQPLFMLTCSQWYDQHILARAPTEKEADGLCHVRAVYRLLSIPAGVARELEQTAKASEPTPGAGRPGFLANHVNDFERPIDPNRVYNGALWRHTVLSTEEAHSGQHSIKLTGRGLTQPVSASPTGGGTGVYGETGKRYRLSAWVKARLEEGEAYLQADDYLWNEGDVRATRRSKGLWGNSKWSELSLEFSAGPNDPFINVKLCVAGTGSAWFDDVALMEIE